MMTKLKITFVVCTILVLNCDLVHSVNNDSDELEKITESCKTQETATDEDMSAWRHNIKPETKIVKCIEACIGEKLGMLTNNKLNIDAVMNVIQTWFKNENGVIDNYKGVVYDCKSITNSDRCEASSKILNCLNGGARKRGLKELF